MKKSALLQSLIVLIGVLLLMALAYWHSMQVSRLYDEAMHRDIQQFSQILAASELPKVQAQALSAILIEVHHHTLSFVASEADALIGTIACTGILVMSAVLGLASRLARGAQSGA